MKDVMKDYHENEETIFTISLFPFCAVHSSMEKDTFQLFLTKFLYFICNKQKLLDNRYKFNHIEYIILTINFYNTRTFLLYDNKKFSQIR